MAKGENAGNEFSPFPMMFSTLPKTNFNFSVTFILSSTNAFNAWSSLKFCRLDVIAKSICVESVQVSVSGRKIIIIIFKFIFFLAQLSTTCSRGAFRVAMCPSCVINNFFKHLLPNRWANWDQTWQECSLGGPLQKLFTEFNSINLR